MNFLSERLGQGEKGLSVPLLHARYARVTGTTVGKSLRLARLNAVTALLRGNHRPERPSQGMSSHMPRIRIGSIR